MILLVVSSRSTAERLGGAAGEVCYFAPDTLRWESLKGLGYSDFLVVVHRKTRSILRINALARLESEAEALTGDQAFSIYPPLWTKEGKNIAKCSRKPGPVDEIFWLNVVDLPRQREAGSET